MTRPAVSATTDDDIDIDLAIEGFDANDRYPEYGHEALRTAWRAGFDSAIAATAVPSAVPAEAERRCSFKAPAHWGVSGCLLPAGHPEMEHEHVKLGAAVAVEPSDAEDVPCTVCRAQVGARCRVLLDMRYTRNPHAARRAASAGLPFDPETGDQ